MNFSVKKKFIFKSKIVCFYLATSTSQQLASLSAQAKDTRKLLNHTKDLSADQNAEAEKVYDEAARVLSNADSIKLPSVLPQELRNNAIETKEAAKQALKMVQDKIQEHQPVMQEAQQALSDAQNEYRNVEAKQKVNNFLLLLIILFRKLIIY